MSGPFFTNDQIRAILSKYGYTANPDGLITFFPQDYVIEGDDSAYLDVNAIAVRKGDEVPDRPIRITFRKISYGHSSRWELESVAELAQGVKSAALDRDEYTQKISPWPRTTAKEGNSGN
jgi:hypothetical protein